MNIEENHSKYPPLHISWPAPATQGARPVCGPGPKRTEDLRALLIQRVDHGLLDRGRLGSTLAGSRGDGRDPLFRCLRKWVGRDRVSGTAQGARRPLGRRAPHRELKRHSQSPGQPLLCAIPTEGASGPRSAGSQPARRGHRSAGCPLSPRHTLTMMSFLSQLGKREGPADPAVYNGDSLARARGRAAIWKGGIPPHFDTILRGSELDLD